jgi:hypothetical protein
MYVGGTLSEQLSKLSDSIYFQSPPGAAGRAALYVNLFVGSSLDYRAGGARLVQSTDFPVGTGATTTLTIRSLDGRSAPKRFALMLRVPSWANGSNSVTLNGKEVLPAGFGAGKFLRLEFQWEVGDVIVASYPMAASREMLRDERSAFNATMAFKYAEANGYL